MRLCWGKRVRRVYNSGGVERRHASLNVSYVPITRACQPRGCYVNAISQEWEYDIMLVFMSKCTLGICDPGRRLCFAYSSSLLVISTRD